MGYPEGVRLRSVLSAVSVLGLVVACTSGGSGDAPSSASSSGASSGGSSGSSGNLGNAPSFTGTIEAPAPPEGTKVVVLWSVFAGSPDYLYAFGAGSTKGASVYVSLSGPPPAEALNDGKIGIGLVATVAAGTDIAEGKLEGDIESAVQGFSPDHAIIYRNSTEQVLKSGWDVTFPQGYACGRCQRAEAGFDGYAVDDCANLKIVPMSANPDACNFT